MIVVKIELWPKGHEDKAREIGRMHLTNQFTKTVTNPKLGDYLVQVLRRGTTDKVTREGIVFNYPRQSYNIWRLITRALKVTFPEEK
jgi:hypothetical protein